MAKKINIYKLYSGGVIIGELDSENENEYVLSNPRNIAPQMTMQGYVLAMSELIPHKIITSKKIDTVNLLKSQVMIVVDETDVIKEIIDEYRSDISGIDIVSGVNTDLLKTDPPKGGDIII